MNPLADYRLDNMREDLMLVRMIQGAAATLGLLLLSGCFQSEKPLIADGEQFSPYGNATYAVYPISSGVLSETACENNPQTGKASGFELTLPIGGTAHGCGYKREYYDDYYQYELDADDPGYSVEAVYSTQSYALSDGTYLGGEVAANGKIGQQYLVRFSNDVVDSGVFKGGGSFSVARRVRDASMHSIFLFARMATS